MRVVKISSGEKVGKGLHILVYFCSAVDTWLGKWGHYPILDGAGVSGHPTLVNLAFWAVPMVPRLVVRFPL